MLTISMACRDAYTTYYAVASSRAMLDGQLRSNVEISMFPVFLPYGIFVELQEAGNTAKSSIPS